MSLKSARSAAPFVLGLTLVALSLAVAVVPGSPSGASVPGAGDGVGSRPILSLDTQSPWVLPGQSWRVQLTIGSVGATAGLRLVMTVYQQVSYRSTFDQTLSGNDGPVLDEAQALPVTGSHVSLSLPVVTGETMPAATPEVDLRCPSSPGECQGVYPVSLALERQGSSAVIGRLSTYLTFVESTSPSKLRVSVVVPFGAPVTARHTDDPAAALPPPTAATVSRLSGLAGALDHPGSPVTVDVDPRTVQALRDGGTAADDAVLAAVGQLSSAAEVAPSGSQWPVQPYVPIDVGALAGAGLTGEIQLQMAQGGEDLRGAVHTTAGPLTWIATGPVGADLAEGLQDARASSVVVPDTALASDPVRLGISQTFGLSLGRGAPVPAAAADTGLASLFDSSPADPALGAYQLLAELALIHFEEPNASVPRGVVVVAPTSWNGDPRFVDTLLSGLSANPVVAAVTLSQFFSEVPAGGSAPDTEPTVRHLAPGSGAGPVVPRPVARGIATARLHQDSFQSAVVGQPKVLGQLGSILLVAESDRLVGTSTGRVLTTYERSLSAQLAQVQLATDRTITLTSRTAPVPVTILSSAGYPMVGTLALASDKFEFPEGATRNRFVLSRSTNSVRIVVQARTSGDLPLDVTLTAPRVIAGTPPLVITRGQLTVRSTATSLVGIVLTLAAAAVLLGWWARTWWRRRSGTNRASRPAGGTLS